MKTLILLMSIIIFIAITNQRGFAVQRTEDNVSTEKKSPQMIREEEFIRTTASRGFDELVDAIGEHDGENTSIVFSSGMTSGLDPNVHLRQVLSDRRVAKLYQILSELPKDEASRRITAAYLKKLDEYKQRWEKVNSTTGGAISGYYRHGMSSLLLLCCEFCDEKTFNSHCSSWLDWYYEHQGASEDFAKEADPQCLMVINLYVIALVRRGESIDDINERVAKMCEDAECGPLHALTTYKFHSWDWDHRAGQDSKVLAVYPIFRSWGKARKIWGTKRDAVLYRTRVVSKARAWLEPPNKVQQWVLSTIDNALAWFDRWLKPSK